MKSMDIDVEITFEGTDSSQVSALFADLALPMATFQRLRYLMNQKRLSHMLLVT